MKKKTIAVLGSGTFGTAIAIHLSRNKHKVMLWSQNSDHIKSMCKKHCNIKYLPKIHLSNLIIPTNNFKKCLKKSDEIIIAIPANGFINIINKFTKPPNKISWVTKGIDPISNKLFSEIILSRWGKKFPIGIIAGPSFAKEFAHSLPTAMIIASNNIKYQKILKQLLHHNNLYIYSSKDIIGIQLCGAIKNILAIMCGIIDELKYGKNARAILITKGLSEMIKLGIKMGAKKETFIGLAGIGDLILTCTSNQSRNYKFGTYIGRNKNINKAKSLIPNVIEGINNTNQIHKISKKYKVHLPICEQINLLLNNKITIKKAIFNIFKYC
ncbi:NAD(P)H-dependent glycerol-3-phosphate dehydrogenase [Candidatus Legionella polyplacis]|uniref:Glycerol-3-phosphate dehydrogenase [NAD(P)+] n=1 Tax=Candidatus Legionella polyplacis TaxID=2005262 RepID=A0ABZ2GVM1_9GAMM